jgi:hypothetical protein
LTESSAKQQLSLPYGTQFQRRCLPTFSSVRRGAVREQLQLGSLLNYWQRRMKILNGIDG